MCDIDEKREVSYNTYFHLSFKQLRDNQNAGDTLKQLYFASCLADLYLVAKQTVATIQHNALAQCVFVLTAVV